jgi:hypothetical protein
VDAYAFLVEVVASSRLEVVDPLVVLDPALHYQIVLAYAFLVVGVEVVASFHLEVVAAASFHL